MWFRLESILDIIMNRAGTLSAYVASRSSFRALTDNLSHLLSTGEVLPYSFDTACISSGYLTKLKPHSSSFSLFQRYYGKSLPFGKDSFNIPQIGLLTVEQALADYAVMITKLKEQLAATDCPVIVFGGR